MTSGHQGIYTSLTDATLAEARAALIKERGRLRNRRLILTSTLLKRQFVESVGGKP